MTQLYVSAIIITVNKRITDAIRSELLQIKMIFLKTFNNSAALVQDDQGQEQVVLGKGVGFGLKKGDKIDESKVERRFIANSHQDEVNQVKEINASTIDLTNKVI